MEINGKFYQSEKNFPIVRASLGIDSTSVSRAKLPPTGAGSEANKINLNPEITFFRFDINSLRLDN